MRDSPTVKGADGRGRLGGLRWAVLLCVLTTFGFLQLAGLGHPLFWQDEGETAMFGRRVLEYGYPKVHADGNTVYGIAVPMSVAVDADTDAYLGSLWGQYYLASVGVWLGEGTLDPYGLTAWVRGPFVFFGLLGLFLLWWAVQPAVSGRPGARLDLAIGFGILLCFSVSLMLHLREVRYYGPALALLASGVWLQLRMGMRQRRGGNGARPMEAVLALILWLVLFNFFFPAAVALAAWWALEALWTLRGTGGSRASQIRSLLPAAASLLVFGLVALGLVQFFGLGASSSVLAERWAFGPMVYVNNLGHLMGYLLRYEWLAPWGLAEIALWGLARRGAAVRSAAEEPLAARASLIRLCLIYAAVGAFNPIFFERYFMPLGPLLALVLLLDLEALRRLVADVEPAGRRKALYRSGVTVIVLVLLGVAWVRAPEVRGRVSEIRRPVEGPVDASVAYLMERFPDPSALTLATNYEAEAYMFYLGSRVVGRFHEGTPAANALEARVEPDLVIPRSAQPRSLVPVRRYLLQGSFERHELDVADVAYNNIPELYGGRVLSTVHRFETPRPGEAGPPLVIYEREGTSR